MGIQNLLSFGPSVLVPLPLIPSPVGIYKFIFPPKNKNIPEEIWIKLIPGEDGVSFDPQKVTLIKGDKTELNPKHFECTWAEGSGRRPEFLYSSGIITIKKPSTLCKLNFDSYIWEFDLLIDGIEIEGKPIEIVLIHFKRGSRWEKIFTGD